jgi:beta-glucosidase-like glycosyl hydrolase/CubicO group peptidase (beta-lactamase class C family)
MKKPVALAVGLLALLFFSFNKGPRKKQDPDTAAQQKKWVDSVFNTLDARGRLGQLFMVAAYSNKDIKHVREIKELVTKYGIGGLIWMQGGPVRQGKLANYYQGLAKVPLLYSIDGEWGLAMRLDSTTRYPKQMTLGAIQNDSLIYEMGKQIAQECRRLGIHLNFAPVADVNSNPMNPVIGMRSFGEDKYKVAQKAAMYMLGLQSESVMANGKHFPGHGDTDSDSHKTLPYLAHSADRLDSLELYPFRYLIEKGLMSMMVAHLNIPSLDTATNQSSSLSPKVVNDLLKNKLGFKGLVFTDALNMKGVAKLHKPGYVDVKALLAGNDVLLFSENVPKAIEEVEKAIAAGQIKQDEIDEHCRKVLAAKFWCGLNAKQEIVTRNLLKELNTKSGEDLNDRLAEAAVTLLRNENNFLPLRRIDTMRVAEVSFGIEEPNTLYNTLKGWGYTEHIGLAHDAKPEAVSEAFEKINNCDVAIVLLNKTGARAENNYGMSAQTLSLMDSIARLKPSVLVVQANPYSLNKLDFISRFRSVIMGYEYLPSLLKATANVILGFSKPLGKLPVSTTDFKRGSGLSFDVVQPVPSSIASSSFYKHKFGKVDSIALSGIAEKAYPGCEIVALKDGEIIYQKSFGNYTYNRHSKPVDNGTLYDLASLTKIAASSLALMKLSSENKFDYKKTLGDYLPELNGTNKEKLVIEDVLAHQAGLQSWIPFYSKTLEKNGKYKPGYYSKKPSDEFPIQVAKDLYAAKGFKDSVYSYLIRSRIENPGKYLYSDLGYYFMQRIIEQQTQTSLDMYVRNIYASIGLGLTYKPLNYLSKIQIPPTENDSKFRKQLVHGYVHDPGAALLGGVAGHAGLFGNALDVARLMQLFLNKGELNGVRVLDSNVVNDFTRCHFCPKNRRGLCFEKPEMDPKKESPVTSECSAESFGHSGFTGTFAWADPKNKLVVVFLSNRVYPDAEDNKLTKLGIRGKIHKAFYEALKQ